MIRDANSLNSGSVLNADLCIVGAGAAGITIAQEFVSEDTDVILLEGGPLSPSEIEEGGSVYQGNATGLPIDISGSRIRAFGGTTNHWNGWCAPMEEEDFSNGGYPSNARWPIDYEELVPHYKEAQKICDLGGFEYSAQNIGDRGNNPLIDLENTQLRNVVYQHSPPTRFDEKYRSDLENAENITVYYHANLVEILPSQNGERIRRFSCETIDGPSFEVEADQFILALGGLENPRLLLASTSRSSRGVGNDNDQVGRYFMQHPHFDTEAYLILKEFDESFYQWHSANTLDDSDGQQIETELRGAIAMEYSLRRNNDIPNIACTIEKVDSLDDSRIPKRSIASLPEFLPDDMALYKLYIRGEQKPIKESRVKLSNQTDIFGMPRIEVDWRIAESDMRKYKQFLREFGREISRLNLGRIWTRLTADNQFKYQNIWGGAHHMGTTRMSEQPEQGVVDKNCQVHNLSNLYIAGSSVFPTVGYANPTLTIVALAHRLADHLKGEL
jgi:choline dehydrogenase-like flavoprotein